MNAAPDARTRPPCLHDVICRATELLDLVRAHRFTAIGFAEYARNYAIDETHTAAMFGAVDSLVAKADAVLEMAEAAEAQVKAARVE